MTETASGGDAIDDGSAEPIKVLFCGDRQLSVRVVQFLTFERRVRVIALGLNPTMPASAVQEIIAVAGVRSDAVLYGRGFSSEAALRYFAGEAPTFGVCCGFSSIIGSRLLSVPARGWINLHRSYLPYNRGLDPLQWALIDDTPAGVTVHTMTEAVDAGPVLGQRMIPSRADDGIAALHTRADDELYGLFQEIWPRLLRGDVTGKAQDEDLATYHSHRDCEQVRRLDLNETMSTRRLLNILRAYSGEDLPAYFEVPPTASRITVRVRIKTTEP